MSNISPAMEDYLETVLLLSRENGIVRVTDIAQKMQVAKSSVHTALHNLADKGLIIQEYYGTIQLTEEGQSVSAAIYARHKSLMVFFEEILGVSTENAVSDACAVEHILSKESMERITALTKEHLDNKKK